VPPPCHGLNYITPICPATTCPNGFIPLDTKGFAAGLSLAPPHNLLPPRHKVRWAGGNLLFAANADRCEATTQDHCLANKVGEWAVK
jgi:hypothetical protein